MAQHAENHLDGWPIASTQQICEHIVNRIGCVIANGVRRPRGGLAVHRAFGKEDRDSRAAERESCAHSQRPGCKAHSPPHQQSLNLCPPAAF